MWRAGKADSLPEGMSLLHTSFAAMRQALRMGKVGFAGVPLYTNYASDSRDASACKYASLA